MLAKELEETLQYLQTCNVCYPPRTTEEDCPHCPVDHGMKEEPTMVAGFHATSRGSGPIRLPVTADSR
jgi:hypothetical protein